MQIVNYRQVMEGKVIARFDLYLGEKSGITYPNFKVLRSSTGGWYPQRPAYVRAEREDGSKEWGYYPEMNKEKWNNLERELVSLLKPFTKDFPF